MSALQPPHRRTLSQLALLLAFASLTAAACGEGSTSTSNSIRQYNDTWLWNGADWTEAHSAISPSPRTAPALAYDEATHQLVLFGGRSTTGDLSFFDDTWTWDGDAWTQQHPAHSPGGRDEAGLVYDAETGAAIANPNGQPAQISVYFTDGNGADFAAGTFSIPANGQVAGFFDQPPFKSATSSQPVATRKVSCHRPPGVAR